VRLRLALLGLAVMALFLGSGSLAPAVEEPGVSFSEEERSLILQHSPLGPLPADPSNSAADDERAARLGQRLFFERRLSRGEVSCSTCHDPGHGFSDRKPVSEGR